MSFKADLDALFVYQPLSSFERVKPVTDDKCHEFVKMKHTAAIINAIFTIASVIPGVSIITAFITLYKIKQIEKMSPEQFEFGQIEKDNLLFMLDVKARLQIYGLGILAAYCDLFTHLMPGECLSFTPRKEKVFAPIELDLLIT